MSSGFPKQTKLFHVVLIVVQSTVHQSLLQDVRWDFNAHKSKWADWLDYSLSSNIWE